MPTAASVTGLCSPSLLKVLVKVDIHTDLRFYAIQASYVIMVFRRNGCLGCHDGGFSRCNNSEGARGPGSLVQSSVTRTT